MRDDERCRCPLNVFRAPTTGSAGAPLAPSPPPCRARAGRRVQAVAPSSFNFDLHGVLTARKFQADVPSARHRQAMHEQIAGRFDAAVPFATAVTTCAPSVYHLKDTASFFYARLGHHRSRDSLWQRWVVVRVGSEDHMVDRCDR